MEVFGYQRLLRNEQLRPSVDVSSLCYTKERESESKVVDEINGTALLKLSIA